MMSKENMLTVPDVTMDHIDYAFFTNENGHSDAGYLIHGEKTRNLNLASPAQQLDKGYDSPDRVLDNLQLCFQELGGINPVQHKFHMMSYYANLGKSDPLIISCDSLPSINELKAQASRNLFSTITNTEDPNYLELNQSMRDALIQSDIAVIRADALIFKYVRGESVAVVGASGDAHPIMMFDDANKVACYISGSHHAIRKGVFEQSLASMRALGAQPENIRVVIGPGLGPKSYEFGKDAHINFSLPKEGSELIFTPVMDEGQEKNLINIKNLVIALLKDKVAAENIYDIGLDTMGFDLYDEIPATEQQPAFLKRKTTINFEELSASGPLLFGARRKIMEQTQDLKQHNPGAYNTVGRHGAGFCLKS